MRVQFFTSYSDLYGANRSLLAIAKHLNCKGHEIKIYLPQEGEMTARLKENNIGFEIIPFYAGFLYIKPLIKHSLIPLLMVWDVILFPIILSKSKKFNPDIVYSNSSLENLGIFVAKILGKKHISHIREFMSKDYNSYFVLGSIMKRKFINWSDGVVFVSQAVSEFIKKGIDFNALNTVIYNGLEVPELLPQHSLLKGEEIDLGLVGIFDEAKGQYIAIEFFHEFLLKYPNAKLHLYGDKNCRYKNRVLKLIQKLKLQEKVILHGFVSNRNEIFSSIDILLMFSKSEGFGRVTIEAMRYGIPVVGFDNAGTSEIISHNVNGFLFSNYSTFESGLISLIECPNKYQDIQQNAFRILKEKFSEEYYVDNVEEFISSVYYSKKD